MAGRKTSAVNVQVVTPSVSTRPRLSSPLWLATINAPKPRIVVSASTSTELAVEALIR